MKTILGVCLGVCTLALELNSATFNVGWDQSPALDAVTGYRLYSLNGTNRTLLSTVSTNIASVTQPDGLYKLSVTATNVIGLESDLSVPLYVVVLGTNVVGITSKPGAPLNLQLR